MKCICGDRHHSLSVGLWHRAYCHWYDHDRAGHKRRAAFWGFVADRLCQLVPAT